MYFNQKELYYVFSITEQYPVVSFYFQELLKANSSFLNLVIFVVEWRKCTMIANPTNLERYVLCNVIECIISGNVISHRILLEQVAQKKKYDFHLNSGIWLLPRPSESVILYFLLTILLL